MKDKYLITGGSGFFGQILAKKLLEKNFKVRILDINKPNIVHNNLEFIECDITKIETIKKAFDDIEIVYHNAATLPIANNKKLFWSVNYEGTKNIVNLSIKNKVKKFIYISSSSIYANNNEKIINEETKPIPLEDNGKSKLEGENYSISKRNEFNSLIVIRPRTIIGKGRFGLFQIIYEWIYKNYKIPVLNKGKNLFQFIYSEDLLNACLLSEKLDGYYKFNIGSENIFSIYDIVYSLINHANSKSKIITLPKIITLFSIKIFSFLKISPVTTWHVNAIIKDQFYDISKSKRILNWYPKNNDKVTLCDSYDYYIKKRKNVLNKKNTSLHNKKLKKGILTILEFFLKN